MKRAFRALRTWFRGDRKWLRRPILKTKPRLSVELLEERLAPVGDFRSVIGLDAVQNLYPYRGTGYTVAVLDTGIDYNDVDLGGGFGAGHRVVAGYDFINNRPDPMDDNGHGTHIAGIIGSSNPSSPGIAPDVHFVALKVLDATMNGTWTALDNALQWVISHKTQYNIVGVNLSLGSGNYVTSPYSFLDNDFTTLRSLGVFTAAASGNQYYTFHSQPGLSYPSISPYVVSVGATWAADAGPVTFSTGASESSPTVDHIVSFTQRSSALSLLAPGAWITSTWLGGTTHVLGGTSMSAAVVSGAAVLLHQACDQTGNPARATQDNLLNIMQTTGVIIVDVNYGTDNVAHTGLSFKRLDLKAALDSIHPLVTPPTLAPIPDQTLHVGETIVVPLSLTNPSGNPVTFSVTQVYLPALAYQLAQQYGFHYLGSYYQNSQGGNEKWIGGDGNIWYCILPSGEVRRWAGSMANTLAPASLIATLDASYYNDPAKLWNAPYAGMPPAVFSFAGNQLSIFAPSYWVGVYSVVVSASFGNYTVQQTFRITEVPANPAPVLAPIPDQVVSHNQDANVNLSATNGGGGVLTYSAQVRPVNGQTPPIQVTVQGNHLTLHPTRPIVGTFVIAATVSNGTASATRTFNLTLTNSPPALGAVSPQTLTRTQTSLTIALPASDPDNDPLTFQATAQTPDARAYQLNQQYAFQPSNETYYLNLWGYNEKWLIGRNNQWYALLPTGKLYHWSQSIAQTFTAANLIATLDPKFYTEPRLLWNANPPSSPALTFSFQGNQLTIRRSATLTGVFFIDVTVSDGFVTATRTIQVTLN
jgi:Subtilase family